MANPLHILQKKEGLSHNWVLSILEDSQGNLWFGTGGRRGKQYDGETFTHFTEKEGLSSNKVRSLLEDIDNTIWVSTTNGLNRLVFSPESVTPVIHTYSKQDGMKVAISIETVCYWIAKTAFGGAPTMALPYWI